jgi:uncharacterized paraquat-inducible protein A
MKEGVLMMGFGLLITLMVLGLLILLIIAIVIGVLVLDSRRKRLLYSPPPSNDLVRQDARYCTHCGQVLQSDWAHCPKCGAPV